MKRFTLILCVLLLPAFGFGQYQSFIYPDSKENYCDHFIETGNAETILLMMTDTTFLSYQNLSITAIKLAQDYSVLLEKKIVPPTNYTFRGSHGIANFDKTTGDFYIYNSPKNSLNGERQVWFCQLDSTFNTKWQQLWGTDSLYELAINSVEVDSNIYSLIAQYHPDSLLNSSSTSIGVLKLSKITHEFSYHNIPELKGKLIAGGNLTYLNSFFYCSSIDSVYYKISSLTFDVDTIVYPCCSADVFIPNGFAVPFKAKKLAMLGSGVQNIASSQPDFYDIRAFITNENGYLVDSIGVTGIVNNDISPSIRTMDFGRSGKLFVAGIEDNSTQFPTSDWLGVYCISAANEAIWRKTFNLGKRFLPTRLHATLDGGVAISGYIYYPPNETPNDLNGDRDAFIIKFDSLGNLVASNFDIKSNNSPTGFSLFPNPATNLVHVSMKGQTGGYFQILNILGEVIFHKQLEKESSIFDIDVSKFSNGNYWAILTASNKQISYSKLVVQNID